MKKITRSNAALKLTGIGMLPAGAELTSPAAAHIQWPAAIGVAAQSAGVSARMVRHYESLGLLGDVSRTDSGYRQYTVADVNTLRFIRRARDLGFSIEEITHLLSLWNDKKRSSSAVKRIAQQHIEELSQRIEAMQTMQRSLMTLTDCCQGNQRPECPILDDLAAPDRP